MRNFVLFAGLASLSACGIAGQLEQGTADSPTGEPELVGDAPIADVTQPRPGPLRLGGGYRGVDDPCRRAGASQVTAPFRSAQNDLVACPIEFSGRPRFIQATNAREVTRTQDWVVYSVPLVGEALNPQIPPTPPITGAGADGSADAPATEAETGGAGADAGAGEDIAEV
jgi:hypothetical protein